MNIERSALFFMANLGSEVTRFLAALDRGDETQAREALRRAEQILLKLKELDEMKPRVGEVELLEKVLADFLMKPRQYSVQSEELKNYFIPFAVRAVENLSQSS